MANPERVLAQVLDGGGNANIRFEDLRRLLRRLGFEERIKGGHHMYFRDDVPEILNLQPKRAKAKPYQVRQVRDVIIRNRLVPDEE